MTLLDPPATKPEKSRAMAFTIAALTLVVVVVLFFTFRYYPEKRATQRFLDALVAGNTERAYQLWKPSPSYSMKDFLADWGPQGYYGPVKSYTVLHTCSPRGANTVEVRTAVSPFSPMPNASDMEKSRKTKVVSVWVLTSDKSLSFPPGSTSCGFL